MSYVNDSKRVNVAKLKSVSNFFNNKNSQEIECGLAAVIQH